MTAPQPSTIPPSNVEYGGGMQSAQLLFTEDTES